MSFWKFLDGKVPLLCATGIGVLFFVLACDLCGVPLSMALVLAACPVLWVLVYLILAWRQADRSLKRLRARLEALPEKYLIAETLDRPASPLEREYYLMLKEISRSAIGAVEEARCAQREYQDQVEAWIHQLKTPLTACSLILANDGDPGKLRRELRRADNMTETVLAYARLQTAEKDIQISSVALEALCHQAVRDEMELLIAAGISVQVEGSARVYTDPKPVAFILKQLLINCAKYCRDCHITITLGDDTLIFEDNGPGIPAHELERVTERGFTGTAGRLRGGSTGMGLYIVAQLCEKLNISMSISSREGAYTRFAFAWQGKI